MIRRTIVFIFALQACFSMAGMAQQAAQAPKPAPVVQIPVVTDDVVAKALGESITEKQVLNLIDQIANSQQPQLTPQQFQARNATYFHEALDTLIGGILLKDEAKQKNILAEKAKVDEAMQSVKTRFANEEAYQKALAAQGIKDEDVRKSIEDRMVIQQVLDQALKNLPAATDAEIQKFYDENPQYFEQPEQVHAAMIFLKLGDASTPEQKAEIMKRLEGIRAEIEGKKITFAEAAAKYSDDKKTAASGGDLGLFKRGDLLESLEKVAFATKQGTFAPIVETQFGFHLMNILEVKPPSKAPLDANIKANIKSFLEQKIKQDATKKYVEQLKAKIKVETLMTDEEWNKRHAGK
jgi:peptidyl-prolyl cis-trans isomerase C